MPVLSLNDHELPMRIQQRCLGWAKSSYSKWEGERHHPLHYQGPRSSLPGTATFEQKSPSMMGGGGALLMANQVVRARIRQDKNCSRAYA